MVGLDVREGYGLCGALGLRGIDNVRERCGAVDCGFAGAEEVEVWTVYQEDGFGHFEVSEVGYFQVVDIGLSELNNPICRVRKTALMLGKFNINRIDWSFASRR